MKYINGIPFTLILITMICYIPFRFYYRKRQQIKTTYFHEIILLLFIVYMETLLYLTLYPSSTVITKDVSINLIPFQTIKLYLHFSGDLTLQIINLLGNIVVFIPIGICIPILLNQISFTKIFVIGFGSTLFIETMQLFLSINGIINRSFDVDDLILNTVGVLIGYLLGEIGRKFVPKKANIE